MSSSASSPLAAPPSAPLRVQERFGGRIQETPARDQAAHTLAQATLLVFLFAVPALIALHTASVADPDIWWHLRTGEWIVQHRAVPHTDLFSIFGAGRPWQAYSWLFEVLVYGLFSYLGLFGLLAYTAACVLAITIACYHLVRRLQPDVSLGVLLTFAACFCCGHMYSPRPWLLTILFFVLEMDILMHARRTGSRRELLWLPFLFLLWANIHIQFIDGLLVLGLGWAESALAQGHRGVSTKLDVRSATLVALLSLVATLCNPYGWHIYRVAFELASQPGVLNKIQELQAVPFRDAGDWCVLGLAMAAVAVHARCGRLLSLETALLPAAAYLSFRSQRDIWFVTVVAITILASHKPAPTVRSQTPSTQLPTWLTPVLAAIAACIILSYAQTRRFDESHLTTRLAETLPVRALAFVGAHQYAGPIYNDFGWGGYLLWSRRQPVSIDGRAAFYGDQRIDRSVATWTGQPNWNTDPDLQSAHLIIGPVTAPLVQLLKLDPRVNLVYQDQLAAVFVRPAPN